MTFPAHTVLLCAPNDDQSQADCLAYVARYGLTGEDVKIAIRGDVRCVVAKRVVTLTEVVDA